MKKTLLTHSILEIFIEWKSQGITNGRIAGILGIHYNTLSNWINKGREIAARIEHEEENYLSIFNQNDLVIGVKNELLYKLFIENDRLLYPYSIDNLFYLLFLLVRPSF